MDFPTFALRKAASGIAKTAEIAQAVADHTAAEDWTMTVCDLTQKNCVPCEGGVPAMTEAEAQAMMENLDPGWRLENSSLVRRLSFKGFAKPLMHANLAAFIGDREGHHPDIAFGWGYCTVTFTTHAIGGLSENDFICAAKFDAATT